MRVAPRHYACNGILYSKRHLSTEEENSGTPAILNLRSCSLGQMEGKQSCFWISRGTPLLKREVYPFEYVTDLNCPSASEATRCYALIGFGAWSNKRFKEEEEEKEEELVMVPALEQPKL